MKIDKLVVVDLDECLIRTDLLPEAMLAFVKKSFWNFAWIFFWMLKGPLELKKNLAQRYSPAPELLPYRKTVLDLIRVYQAQGHKVVLASASPQKWVDAIAQYLGMFADSLGSERENLKGQRKYDAIHSKFDTSQFIYFGDSAKDLEIWQKCGAAVGVNLTASTRRKLQKWGILYEDLRDEHSLMWGVLRQLRFHQWAKNALLFVPLLASHRITLSSVMVTCLAVIAFSLTASAVYILNDLLDLESDRRHHSKKNRPLPSGKLSLRWALGEFGLVAILGLIFATQVSMSFLFVILIYWMMNLAYSMALKRVIILDIILLSAMYTVRLFAGATATDIWISNWLLSFSTFFFFSLACVKRYTELIRSQSKLSVDGRGYRSDDQAAVYTLGVGSGLVSILVLLLYFQSPEASPLYTDTKWQWLITGILLYWLSRLWILSSRGQVHDDPVIFAMKDAASWFCLAGLGAVLINSL